MVYIYVLKLEKDKYYIGKTDNPISMLKEMKNKSKMIDIISIEDYNNVYDNDSYYKHFMDKYGIERKEYSEDFWIKDCKKKYEDVLELVSLNSLLTKSPYMIVKIFPILDLINQLKTYRIMYDCNILNYYKTKYENLKEIVDDAIYIYDNHEEYLIKYGFDDIYTIPDLPNQRINFYKELSKLLSSLPSEIYKELSEKNKSFEEIEQDIIKDYL